MNNWKETTLSEVCDKIGDGLHGTPQYSNDGEYYFINGNNLKDGKIIIRKDTKKVNQDEFEKYKKDIDKNTLLLSINGTIGNLAKYKNEKCILGKSAAYLNVKKEINTNYIYYLMLDKKFQNNISKNATGTTIKNVSLAQLRSYNFFLPPLPEQKAIAALLSSLDNKNELLRNQNKTLEKIAQTLFKHWFINFESPFDAKGNPLPADALAKGGYKSSGGKMVQSELGEIPKGWRVGELNEYVDHIKNSVIPARSPKVTFSHYSIPAFDQNQIIKEDGAKILSNKYEVTKNSFLVSKLNPQTPRVWTILEPEENSVCSTEFQVIKPKKIEYYSFVCSFLNSPVFSRELASKAHGTSSSHQRVKPQDIIDVVVIFPDKILIKNFQSLMFPAIKKMISNNLQTQTLSRLRDTLLPKLISGKLRVK